MTALSLFVALAAGVIAYCAWAAKLIAAGTSVWWFVAGAPFAYFAPVCVATTVWLTLSWIWRTPRPADARLDFAGCIRLYIGEAKAIAKSWPLMIVHRLSMRNPDLDATDRGRLPVLLIHGVLVNDGMWLACRRFLEQRGLGPVYTINYGPPFEAIEYFAAQLEARINEICAGTGAKRVMLIGHSMGGLVARAYLRAHGVAKAAGLVTIGTPHHGSRFAWLMFGRCLEQMRPGNTWLAALNETEQTAQRDPRLPIKSIWSRHDSMVAPQASALFGGADNVALIGIGHNALLSDRRVLTIAADEVERVRRLVGSASG